ncbi:hypothetical protein BJ138DRAFT_1157352 [Hygrophoropsis aurantiaca]|uniref:Uncharacterized protein n=1 Tax=Hygrophoropsis aurantiaca TaxID=72124 RepID=A0ACB8A6C6_9AGAM|nr:hypothetical protein BJ138DRAFT_1157352 [Hygrophoropsis aurantiaca]
MTYPPALIPGKRYDLVEGFNALALAGKTDERTLPDIPLGGAGNAPSFVGGFSPDRVALNAALDASRRPHNHQQTGNTQGYGRGSANPLPRPPGFVSMPTPQVGNQSLTMQHALNVLGGPSNRPPLAAVPEVHSPPSRPHSESVLSPPALTQPSISTSLARPSLPVTPQNRPRAASTPVSPTVSSSGKNATNANTVQCASTTKTGKRCSRQVKLPSAHSHVDPAPVAYCHQHRDAMFIAQSGFYARLPGRPDKWIEFNDYIPQYLQRDTQLALRVEMEKAASASDVPGYIYTFEIRDTTRPKRIQFKVGRAVNLVKRLDEWAKQCGSKEQVIRGWWPGSVQDGENGDSDSGSGGGGDSNGNAGNGTLLRGHINPGKAGPLCHRVERLVHIELADLAVHAPYLDARFPKIDTNPSSSQAGASPRKGATLTAVKPCPDCGKEHREIFSFRRAEKGRFKGREWDLIVRPVIEKWGKFVADYYS